MVDRTPPTAERHDAWHPLLRRQIRRAFGGEVPEVCGPLLAAVNDAYHQADLERTLLERSLDLTSEELMERNDSLRAELRERERMAQELQATRAFYENLVSQLPIEVALFDAEGRFLYLNPASIADAELRAWLIGKTNLDYARYRGRPLGPFEKRHARITEVAETGEMTRLEETLAARDGQPVHMLRVHARVPAPDGQGHHVIGYGVNVTEQKQAEEALRRSLVRLDEAQRLARVGYWEIEAPTGALFWSEETFRIFGLDPAGPTPTWGDVQGQFHPDDRASLLRSVQASEPRQPRDFELRITRADGELRTLAASGEVIRGMDGRLTHVFGVCVDVTEQKRHEEALERAREQAEAAQQRAEEMLRLKSALLSNMSHEIRTPLTGILGFSEVLAEEVAAEHEEFARVIHTNARRLLDTLNSVLDLAQLESGSMALSAQRVDAVAEAQNVATLLHPLAREKGIELRFEAPRPAFVLGDATALHRVMANLVGNAIKFTERGEVEVAVKREDEGVALTVRDTGRGISEDFLPHLFDEFKQESTGMARFHEGNGLGLAITHRLVELMGGEIRVESELGRGTTFEVRLPAWEPVEA